MTRALPWVLAAAAVLWGGWQARRGEQARGEASAARRAYLRAQWRADSLAGRLRVDTAIAVRWRTRYDSVRVTDTLAVTDTVTQTVTVYVPRAAADSAVRTCTTALSTCGAALAAQQAATAAARAEADQWRTAARGCRVLGLPCPTVSVGVGAAFADGRLAIGPTVAFGVPIRF